MLRHHRTFALTDCYPELGALVGPCRNHSDEDHCRWMFVQFPVPDGDLRSGGAGCVRGLYNSTLCDGDSMMTPTIWTTSSVSCAWRFEESVRDRAMNAHDTDDAGSQLIASCLQ